MEIECNEFDNDEDDLEMHNRNDIERDVKQQDEMKLESMENHADHISSSTLSSSEQSASKQSSTDEVDETEILLSKMLKQMMNVSIMNRFSFSRSQNSNACEPEVNQVKNQTESKPEFDLSVNPVQDTVAENDSALSEENTQLDCVFKVENENESTSKNSQDSLMDLEEDIVQEGKPEDEIKSSSTLSQEDPIKQESKRRKRERTMPACTQLRLEMHDCLTKGELYHPKEKEPVTVRILRRNPVSKDALVLHGGRTIMVPGKSCFLKSEITENEDDYDGNGKSVDTLSKMRLDLIKRAWNSFKENNFVQLRAIYQEAFSNGWFT